MLFLEAHLLDGEIPKIMPFSKFNIKTILGDFQMDPLGVPVLAKDDHGGFTDQNGARVNSKGYLVDAEGHLLDKNGN